MVKIKIPNLFVRETVLPENAEPEQIIFISSGHVRVADQGIVDSRKIGIYFALKRVGFT